MKKRLQVLFDEGEYREIQTVARREWMTVAEWVRQALRKGRHDHFGKIDGKLNAITEASRQQFPTADIRVMLREIEAGRGR